MKKPTLLLLLVFFIFQDIATAYPISPRPLRKLIIESDFIVEVYVRKTEPANTQGNFRATRAILEVRGVLQGSISQDTIHVYFAPNLVCPQPPRYPDSSQMLVFLDTAGSTYITHALSYGAKVLDPHGIKIYRKRIAEMQQILKIEDEQKHYDETLKWLVRCAKEKVTRWEGVYELSPGSDFMSFYDRDKDMYKYTLELSESQIAELRAVVFRIDTLEYPDLGLIDLVREQGDSKMAGFLTGHLKRMDADAYWVASELMKRVAYCYGRNDLFDIIREMEEKDVWDSEPLTKQHYIDRFIAEI